MTPATPHHAAAMAAIHAAVFPGDPWSALGFSILLGQPGVAGFIDERGGLVLLRCAADEAEILTLGVLTQRQGIGRLLMQSAIAHAQARNAATLHLEVAASNRPACTLYRSLGFTEAGRRRNYYANGADALILSLPISDAAR